MKSPGGGAYKAPLLENGESFEVQSRDSATGAVHGRSRAVAYRDFDNPRAMYRRSTSRLSYEDKQEVERRMTSIEVMAEFTAPAEDDDPVRAEIKHLLTLTKTEPVKKTLTDMLHLLEEKAPVDHHYDVKVAFGFVVLVRGWVGIGLCE